MSMKYVLFIFIFWMMQSIFCSCSEPTTKVETTVGHSPELTLNDAGYHLPDRPGYDLFLSNCGVCHSYRYIQMQPNFSRKTWEKTVDKMIHTFAAPIPDSSVIPILDYLMAVRGKK